METPPHPTPPKHIYGRQNKLVYTLVLSDTPRFLQQSQMKTIH